MDDPAAESAGANGVHARRLQMSLTSVCFVRVAQFAAGSLLLLLAAAWGTTRAGATQEVDPGRPALEPVVDRRPQVVELGFPGRRQGPVLGALECLGVELNVSRSRRGGTRR